jgi:hypothetical protein
MTAEQTNKVADAAQLAVNIDVHTNLLNHHYPSLPKATGAAYVALAAFIEGLERSLASLKKRSFEEIHAEFAKSVAVTFVFDDPDGSVAPDTHLSLVGVADELGANDEKRAVPLRRVGRLFTSAPIELIRRKGDTIALQYLVKTGDTPGSRTLVRRFPIFTVTLPTKDTATVTATATGATVA